TSSAMSRAEKRIREMTRPSYATVVVTMVAGAIAGGTTGIMAGPLGAAIGAGIGATMGVAAGITIQFMDTLRRRHDSRLDRDIGVDGGDLGAGRGLTHPEGPNRAPRG